MNRTKIEWCDWTANPIRARRLDNGNTGHACVKFGPDCANCYAESINRRFGTGLAFEKPSQSRAEFFLDEAELTRMARLRGPGSCFVADMTDLWQDGIGAELIVRVVDVCVRNRAVDWLFLSKRPSRMCVTVGPYARSQRHLWFGASWGAQGMADKRAFGLYAFAGMGARCFVSYEPAIGAWSPVRGEKWNTYGACTMPHPAECVIAGGESGSRRRANDGDWFREVRDACAAHEVAFFFKQWGGPGVSRELDGVLHNATPWTVAKIERGG